MKALILTTLLCVTSAAYAQSDPQKIDTVRIPAVPDRIDLPTVQLGRVMTNFDSYKGSYELSDGRTLYLTASAHRMYAEVDGLQKTEVVGVTSNSFVGVDRSIKLNLKMRDDGEVRGEVLLARPATAAGLPASVERLAMGGN
jgi:hypothetical protein